MACKFPQLIYIKFNMTTCKVFLRKKGNQFLRKLITRIQVHTDPWFFFGEISWWAFKNSPKKLTNRLASFWWDWWDFEKLSESSISRAYYVSRRTLGPHRLRKNDLKCLTTKIHRISARNFLVSFFFSWWAFFFLVSFWFFGEKSSPIGWWAFFWWAFLVSFFQKLTNNQKLTKKKPCGYPPPLSGVF